MDPALLSIFVLLQLVLSPILYPIGYIIQALVVVASGWRKFSLGEIELSLLETLILVCLICNMVMEENITVAGYATRAGILLFRLYKSPRLQHLSMQILEPVTSCFLLVELIASPHLYPVGYLAQLALIFFLALSGSLQMLTLMLLSSRKQFQKQFYQQFAVNNTDMDPTLPRSRSHSSLQNHGQSPNSNCNTIHSSGSGRKSPISARKASTATPSSASKVSSSSAKKKKSSTKKKSSKSSKKSTSVREVFSLVFTGMQWIGRQLNAKSHNAHTSSASASSARDDHQSEEEIIMSSRPPSTPSTPQRNILRRRTRSQSSSTAAAAMSPPSNLNFAFPTDELESSAVVATDATQDFPAIADNVNDKSGTDVDQDGYDSERSAEEGVDEEEEESEEEEDDDDEEDDLMMCKICFEGKVTTAFVSCGHVCCRQCSDTLTSASSRMACPFCQAVIEQKIDIFFP